MHAKSGKVPTASRRPLAAKADASGGGALVTHRHFLNMGSQGNAKAEVQRRGSSRALHVCLVMLVILFPTLDLQSKLVFSVKSRSLTQFSFSASPGRWKKD